MPKSTTKAQRKEPKTRPYRTTKSPKDSHLYTDDNPATTIHGTGFKDEAAARKTLDLIKDRSLTYQFQTVNTMYNRAKHHPSMKKNIAGSANTQGMREAMEVFGNWLEVTYHEQRDALRHDGFRPLLSKKCVEKYLPKIEADESVGANAREFARMYASLAKGKRLGNVLVDDSKPMEADWERLRYDTLDQLVVDGGLEKDDKTITSWHLELVAWAWSPVGESKLP